MRSFKINGIRENRVKEIAYIIFFLILESIPVGIILIMLFQDYIFRVIFSNLLFFTNVTLLYKYNFVTIAQFIVDSEYSKENLYEIESKGIEQVNQEYKVLTSMNIFNEIGFDSEELKDIRDYKHIKLTSEWQREPVKSIPEWNGISLISKYAIKMMLNRI